VAREIMFYEIVDRVLLYHPEANIDLLAKAYVFAARLALKRYKSRSIPDTIEYSGYFLEHPLAVALIVADMHIDEEAIAAALLHNALEVDGITEEEISHITNERVAKIVDGISRLNRLSYTYGKKREQQIEYLRNMILAISRDIRVVLVKLADRVHVMRLLNANHSQNDLARAIAREALDIYAPLAARLGIEWIKKELENISFKVLEPEAYDDIVQKLAKTEEERNAYIERVRKILTDLLKKHGIKGRVLGRPKHLYSIYMKMKTQQIDLNRIYDLIAFRIIVQNIHDCYEVLSIIHSTWEPVPGRFKDFIARPKPNRYQSLHTTVIGPDGATMEIQIRTEEMDKVANEGIAAHWLYKEGRPMDPAKVEEAKRFTWLRQLLEWKGGAQATKEILSSIDSVLFPEDVYVFTPQGEVKVLPKGSTPVDFAYQIHTEVGHRCVGARVNGKIVPLKYELQSGDTVEIITSKTQRPSQDWLQFVKTAKARNRIRHWLKMAEQEQAIAIGREMCEKEFRKRGLQFGEFINSPEMLQVAESFSLKSVDDLLAAVGFMKITPGQVLGRFMPEPELQADADRADITTEQNRKEAIKKISRSGDSVRIMGTGNIMTHFARCCNPLPGEPIIGYITRGRGVTIHRKSCKNIQNAEPERLIDVEWDTSSEDLYTTSLKILFSDKKGMLAHVSSLLGQMDAEMLSVQVVSLPDGVHEGRITVAVKDQEHLKKLIMILKGEKEIYAVERLAG